MIERLLYRLAFLFAAACVLPIVAVAVSALTGDLETWRTVLASVLPAYTRTTLILVIIVALMTAFVGTLAAWLVTVYRFPGSRWLEVALALPLAFPAYVLAYAYTYLLDHPGPVQTGLRALTGWGPRDYWFPEIRSLGGAAAMLTIVLYPYVYLLARAAFRQQSAGVFMVARTLGLTPREAFVRVALPMARPAIAGGALLAVMETIADYGTVAFFNVQTFATGIYQAWFSAGDRAAAAQLALCLLVVALFVAALERAQRGNARSDAKGRRFDMVEPVPLRGAAGLGAMLFCLLPVLAGFLIPVMMLTMMALSSRQSLFDPRYLTFFANSVTVAAIAALVTVAGAILLTFRARMKREQFSQRLCVAAGLGYAVPGGVIAAGLMVPFAAFDNSLDAFMRHQFGLSTGLFFTGSITLMVFAYMTRFMAPALNAYDSGMKTVSPNMDAIARVLGVPVPSILGKIHLPLVRTSVLTALLIVFVDVMKELPATLMLHPFNFQTLAVQAHRLAADERLFEAALPSLVLAAAGLIPVLILCYTIGWERTGRLSARRGTALKAG